MKFHLVLAILLCLFGAGAIALVLNLTNSLNSSNGQKVVDGKNYVLPDLPYAYNALEPYIDAETMKIHHDRHHKSYVDNLNKSLKDYPDLQGKPLEELLSNLENIPENIRADVQNYAGGHLNHSMFWLMMRPKNKATAATQEPTDKLKELIEKDFGSFDKFKEQFSTLAKKLFGSGWAWLILDKNNNKLLLIQSEDQDNPISNGFIPLLGLDVWEHAYYLKYQNKRGDYIDAWWNIVNWPYVQQLYEKTVEPAK